MDKQTAAALQTAYALLKAGKQQEARDILIPIVRADPQIADAWYLLGFALSDPEKRLYAFEQVLRIDPSNQAAQRQIAKLRDVPPPVAQAPAVAALPAVRQKRLVAVLRWVLAGVTVLLVSLVGVSAWWLWGVNHPQAAGGPPPTPTSRYATPRPTVTAYPRPTPQLTATITLTPGASETATPFVRTYSAPNATPNLSAFALVLSPDPRKTLDFSKLSISDSQQLIGWSDSGETASTVSTSGRLKAGGTISVPLDVDNSTGTTFILQWFGKETPTFTLTAPDQQLIDQDYVKQHPDEVTYGTTPYYGMTSYQFKKSRPGKWMLNLAASQEGVYRLFALLTAPDLTLHAVGDLYTYRPGDTATFVTQLENKGAGLAGAAVNIVLALPDSSIETVPMQDYGNGLYAATYTVPDMSGFIEVTVSASGNIDGVKFARETLLQLTIASNDLQLVGNYAADPQDADGDGLYEKLNVTFDVKLVAAGTYTISADLYSGTQMVAHAAKSLDLVAGTQTITLSFYGTEIQETGLDGPYVVTHLSITPNDTGIESQHADNAFTTSAFKYTQFGIVVITIAGNVGLPGVSLDYTGAPQRAVSDEHGNYVIIVPYNWSGTVIPYKLSYGFTPDKMTYTNLKTDQKQDYKPGALKYTIRGNTEIGGVTLTFTPKKGTPVIVKSDSQGNYSVTLPFAWEGEVRPSSPGHKFSPDHIAFGLLGDQVENYVLAYTISGNAGVEGVEFASPSGVVLSKADGSYTVTLPAGWSGTVGPYKAGYSFTPAGRDYTDLQADQSAQDFTAVPDGTP